MPKWGCTTTNYCSHAHASFIQPVGEDTDIPITPRTDDRKFQTNHLFKHILTHDNKQANQSTPQNVSSQRTHLIELTASAGSQNSRMKLKAMKRERFVLEIRLSDWLQPCTADVPKFSQSTYFSKVYANVWMNDDKLLLHVHVKVSVDQLKKTLTSPWSRNHMTEIVTDILFTFFTRDNKQVRQSNLQYMGFSTTNETWMVCSGNPLIRLATAVH